MARIKDHCEDCKLLIGEPFEEIHAYLDQYAEIFQTAVFGEYHRTFLHNKAGINTANYLFGHRAGKAAELHVIRDYVEQPLKDHGQKWLKRNLGMALLYFHNMDNFDLRLASWIVRAWNGKSLCQIAFGDKGYDKYHRNIKDI
jgi:hypothetical protein